jgi:hypothetical protein
MDKNNYNERSNKKSNYEGRRNFDLESIENKVIEEEYSDHQTSSNNQNNYSKNRNRNFNKVKSNNYLNTNSEELSANFGVLDKKLRKNENKEIKENFIDRFGGNNIQSRNKDTGSNIKKYNSNSSQEKDKDKYVNANEQLRSKESLSNQNFNSRNRNLSKESSHSKIKTNYNNTEQEYFMLHRNRKDDKEGFMFRERERSNERQKENMEYLKNQNVLNEKYYPKQAKLAKLKEENIELKNELSRLNGEKKELENKVVNFPDKQISKFQMNKRQKLEKDLEDNIERINLVKKRMREIKTILDY